MRSVVWLVVTTTLALAPRPARADCISQATAPVFVQADAGAASWCLDTSCFRIDLASGKATEVDPPRASATAPPTAADDAASTDTAPPPSTSPDGKLHVDSWDLVDASGKVVRSFAIDKLLHVQIEGAGEFCELSYWGDLLVGSCIVKDPLGQKWPSGHRYAVLSPTTGKKLRDLGGPGPMVVGSYDQLDARRVMFASIDGRRLVIQDITTGKVTLTHDLSRDLRAANTMGRVATEVITAGDHLLVAFGGGAATGSLLVLSPRGKLLHKFTPKLETCAD